MGQGPDVQAIHENIYFDGVRKLSNLNLVPGGSIKWTVDSANHRLSLALTIPRSCYYQGTSYSFASVTFSGMVPDGLRSVPGSQFAIWDYQPGVMRGDLDIRVDYEETQGGGGGRPNITIVALASPENSGLVSLNGAPGAAQQTTIITYGNPVSFDTAAIPRAISGRDFRFLQWESSDGKVIRDPKHSYVPMTPAVWVARYIEVFHAGLILYDKNSSPSHVLYDKANNKVMRDVVTGELTLGGL